MTAKLGTDVAKREFLHTVVESVNLFLFSCLEISLKVSPKKLLSIGARMLAWVYIQRTFYPITETLEHLCSFALFTILSQ